MQTQEVLSDRTLQVTIHFVNGQDLFFELDVARDPKITTQDIRQSIRRFLKEEWWVIQQSARTTIINPANVLNVEFNPPLETLEGEGVLHGR